MPLHPILPLEAAFANLHGKACRRSLGISRRAGADFPRLLNFWAILKEIPSFLQKLQILGLACLFAFCIFFNSWPLPRSFSLIPVASFFSATVDAWTWWIVGLFGCPASCCMSCVRAPWTWGLFMCFCALFSPLNVEGVYNEHLPVVIVILLTSNSAQCQCVSLGRACAVLPLYHYGFGAKTASLTLQPGAAYSWRRGQVRARAARSAPTAIRTFWVQCANSDSQLLRAIVSV